MKVKVLRGFIFNKSHVKKGIFVELPDYFAKELIFVGKVTPLDINNADSVTDNVMDIKNSLTENKEENNDDKQSIDVDDTEQSDAPLQNPPQNPLIQKQTAGVKS